jgi:predicted PhzF superfamily epimerase YddE/YHI9
MTRIFQVDAFTDTPFTGNPAGVCVLDAPADEHWMKAVAAEMNLSETAFLWPEAGGFRLRWFTPAVEVALCGHATLASGHILWEHGFLAPGGQAKFATLSGDLFATRRDDLIVLDFPAEPAETCVDPVPIEAAIEASVLGAWKNRFDTLALVDSEDVVRSIVPDLQKILALGCRGLIVTSRSSNAEYDFVSRFFAPAVGVDEDPVTGSAHCFLGPFWADRLGTSDLTGFQASKRGGVVKVGVRGDRVELGGRAVTVLDGKLLG